MRITNLIYGLKTAAIAGGLFLSINPVAAQDQAVNSIEEVIVTSQRVEESLQDVPIAVTALTADMLEDQQIKSVSGWQHITTS